MATTKKARTLYVTTGHYYDAAQKYRCCVSTASGKITTDKYGPTIQLALLGVLTDLKINEEKTKRQFRSQPLKWVQFNTNTQFDWQGHEGQIVNEIFKLNPKPKE